MAYIDVDKFAEKICDFQAIDEDCATKMIWLLRTFPTADVVEVCRCKDCKYYEACEKHDDTFDGWCVSGDCLTKEADFCNYGERKENE